MCTIRPWRSQVSKSWSQPRHLWFGHDDAKSESFLLDHKNVSDSAMKMLSRKVFYLDTAVSPTQPLQSRAGECPIRPWWFRVVKSSTSPQWRLWFGRDEAELEGLLLGRGRVFDSSIMKVSRRFSDLVAVMRLIQPLWSPVEKSWSPPWRL